MATFSPSTKPDSFKPWRNARKRSALPSGDAECRNPITGIAGCWACAVSGHAAAPLSAASNSRRPMVTVMRPSRARCVKGTIPRHERAVPQHTARAERLAFREVFLGRAVGRVLIKPALAECPTDAIDVIGLSERSVGRHYDR